MFSLTTTRSTSGVFRADARIAFARAQAGVEVELLPQGHVHGAETGSDGRGDRAFKRDFVAADALQDVLGKRRAVFVHDVDSGVVDFPVDLHAGRVYDSCRGDGQFRPHSVTGY